MRLWFSKYNRSYGDGEGTGTGTGTEGGEAGKTFTQDELNTFLANEKRKFQTQNQELVKKLEKFQSENTTSAEQRAQLEQSLEQLRGTYTSEQDKAKQNAERLKAEYEDKLNKTTTAAQDWQNRYVTAEVDRSISDAAIAQKAIKPFQIAAVLKPLTKMEETLDAEGKPTGNLAPVVTFPDVDSKGNQVILKLSVTDAVKRMKERPEDFGNLFEGDMNGGTGNLPNRVKGSNGKLDVGKLSFEDFKKLRKTNPSAIYSGT